MGQAVEGEQSLAESFNLPLPPLIAQVKRMHCAPTYRGNVAHSQAGTLIGAEGHCLRAGAARGLAAVGGAADELQEAGGRAMNEQQWH